MTFDKEYVSLEAMKKLLHATCVELHKKGVLLLGKSGSGKSELALHLLTMGAQLVADDCVLLDTQSRRATCPPNLRNKIEMRGVGIVPVKSKASTRVCLCVNLCPRSQVERFPLKTFFTMEIPTVNLCGHDLVATADKIDFICRQEDVEAFLKVARSTQSVRRKKNCSLSEL